LLFRNKSLLQIVVAGLFFRLLPVCFSEVRESSQAGVNAGEIFPKFAGLKFPLFRQKNILIEADGSDLHAVLHSVRIRLQAYNMAVV
jgi:hypothetical protein